MAGRIDLAEVSGSTWNGGDFSFIDNHFSRDGDAVMPALRPGRWGCRGSKERWRRHRQMLSHLWGGFKQPPEEVGEVERAS